MNDFITELKFLLVFDSIKHQTNVLIWEIKEHLEILFKSIEVLCAFEWLLFTHHCALQVCTTITLFMPVEIVSIQLACY